MIQPAFNVAMVVLSLASLLTIFGIWFYIVPYFTGWDGTGLLLGFIVTDLFFIAGMILFIHDHQENNGK